mgnify:CR=1 FL=1
MDIKQIVKSKIVKAENNSAKKVYRDKPVNINEFVRIKYKEKF